MLRTDGYLFRLLLLTGFGFLLACHDRQGEPFVPTPLIAEPAEIVPLEIGNKAPEFTLPGTDGKWYGKDDFRKDILVVVFLSNYCPNAQVYEERLIRFVNDYKDKGVDLVAISPNSPLAIPDDALGYSDLDDRYESMQIRAREKQFNFPYLYDGDDQRVSRRFGITNIPSVYVFDKSRVLRYRGRIDVSAKWLAADAEDLRMAVDAINRNGEIIRPARDYPGCKVYWSWDQKEKDVLTAEWNAAPVTLERISLDSLKTVLVNFSTHVRIINFWATWCGPCKQEFPEFLLMKRMYRHRPVEFITVSLDGEEHYHEALTFLQQLHAPGTNYLLAESDKERIRKMVYESWDGTLPFTIMVDPLGSPYRVWQGPFDPLEVKKAIVDHRLVGRYLRY